MMLQVRTYELLHNSAPDTVIAELESAHWRSTISA